MKQRCFLPSLSLSKRQICSRTYSCWIMSFIKMIRLSIVFPLLLSLPVTATAQAARLRLQLKPGMEFSIETSSQTEMNQIIFGIDQTIGVDMQIVTNSKVKDFKNKAYHLDFTYTSLNMKTSSAIYHSVINTREGTNDESELMRVIIGKTFKVEISERGAVLRISGLDSIIKSATPDLDLDSVTLNTFKESLLATFGEDAFAQTLRQVFIPFPDSTVAKSDTWTSSYQSLAANMPISIFNVITLKERNSRQLLLQIQGNIKTNSNYLTDINGYSGTIELKGESISEAVLDPVTLLCTRSTLSQELQGSIQFKPDPDSEQIMNVPTRITLKSNSNLVQNR